MSRPEPLAVGILLARLTELRAGSPTPPRVLYRCRECRDDGLVPTEDANTCKPCGSCNVAAYDRWRQGSYAASDRRVTIDAAREPEDQSVRDRRRFGGRREDVDA